jgi:hypothetical protein
MTKDLANIFKNSLLSLKTDGLISNLEGLVRLHEFKPSGGDKTLKIAYPVDCEEPEDCVECKSLYICVPEKTKKCLVYFEGYQSRATFPLQTSTKYESVLSLICWYNLDFFETSDLLQSRLISLFSEKIKKTYSEENPINFVNPEIVSVTDSDASIFSKYSYNESNSGFLGCKYATFRIDFKINFLLNEDSNCINNILANSIVSECVSC